MMRLPPPYKHIAAVRPAARAVLAALLVVGLGFVSQAQNVPAGRKPVNVLDTLGNTWEKKGKAATENLKRETEEAKKLGERAVKKSNPDTLVRQAGQHAQTVVKRQAEDVKTQAKQLLDTGRVTGYSQQVRDGINGKKDEVVGFGKSATQTIRNTRPDSLLKEQTRGTVSGVRTQVDQEKERTKALVNGFKRPDLDASWGSAGGNVNSPQLESLKNWKAPDGDIKLGSVQAPTFVTPVPGRDTDIALPGFSANGLPQPNSLNPEVPLPRPEPEALRHFKNTADSLSRERFGLNEQWLQRFDVQTILSDRHMQELIDSLGLKKADSLYKRFNPLLNKKELGARDMLTAINSSFAGQLAQGAPDLTSNDVMREARSEALAEARKFNPGSFKLPDATLAELPALSGNVVDEKYLRVVDSLRKLNLRRQDLKLLNREFAEDQAKAIFKEKPSFWDKAYVNAVIGVLSSGDATLYQASPALGYHIHKFISLGVGPAITVQKADDSYFAMVGVRSFAKGEFWKQRAYGQVEYQMKPYRIDSKSLLPEEGKWLVGGGYIQQITSRLGLTIEVLYRVTPMEVEGTTPDSPWVFRIGLSTMKPK